MPKCKITPKTTTRKFYNKWLYKCTLGIPGCSLFRWNSLGKLKDRAYLEEIRSHSYRRSYMRMDNIQKLATFLDKADQKWGKRIESSYIDIYTNSKNLYEDISLKFENEVVHRFEPDPGTLDHLENSRTVVVKKLPHDKYQYKVYLSIHKSSEDEKQSLLNFFETHCERIKCSESVKKWIRHSRVDYDRRYILVEDEPTLLMLKMAHSKLLGQTYSHVLVDK